MNVLYQMEDIRSDGQMQTEILLRIKLSGLMPVLNQKPPIDSHIAEFQTAIFDLMVSLPCKEIHLHPFCMHVECVCFDRVTRVR